MSSLIESEEQAFANEAYGASETVEVSHGADSRDRCTSTQNANTDGKLTGYLVFCLLVSAFGAAFQFGWSLGVFNTPSDTIKQFYRDVYTHRNETLTNDTLNTLWAISNGLIPLGGMVGGLSSGFIADLLGRKSALMAIELLVVTSASVSIASKYIMSFEALISARFITGVFCGLFSGILPLYLSELAPKNLRGSIGALNQLLIVFGILATNICGLPDLLGSDSKWPILLALSLIPAGIHMLLVFAPETPKFLIIKHNAVSKARNALLKLRNGDRVLVESEIKELEEEKERLSQQTKVKWSEFWTRKTLRRPLIVTVVIQMSQQLSGINSVIFYSNDIFEDAGLTGSWPTYATILLGLIQFIMTFVCMTIVDKLGRRVLLVTGMFGMSVFAFSLALFRILAKNNPEMTWLNTLTVLSALAYVIFFSIGPGAIPWLITSELFASDSRGKATSIAVFVNWSANFLVTVSFVYIEAIIHSYSFVIFGVLLIFFGIFIKFFVPETKGKSIDEIVHMFEQQYIFN